MDKKVLYNMTYGLYMLSSKSSTKLSGCIIDTCMQVANSPLQLAVSCMNGNYTCDIIKDSGLFTLSILDQTCTFPLICHFGYQSGRNVDKFQNLQILTDANGLPFLIDQACGVISCKVIEQIDLGTHTMFIGEVMDTAKLSSYSPLTYSDYLSKIKPSKREIETRVSANKRKIVGWKCRICGYEYRGEKLPPDFECPMCGHPKEDFEPVYGAFCSEFA